MVCATAGWFTETTSRRTAEISALISEAVALAMASNSAFLSASFFPSPQALQIPSVSSTMRSPAKPPTAFPAHLTRVFAMHFRSVIDAGMAKAPNAISIPAFYFRQGSRATKIQLHVGFELGDHRIRFPISSRTIEFVLNQTHQMIPKELDERLAASVAAEQPILFVISLSESSSSSTRSWSFKSGCSQ